jgi:hypothetical protein
MCCDPNHKVLYISVLPSFKYSNKFLCQYWFSFICLQKCWTINGFFPFYSCGNFFFFLVFKGCVLNMFDSIWFGCGIMEDFSFLFIEISCGNMYTIAPSWKLMFWISSIWISYRITSPSIDCKCEKITYMYMLCIVSGMWLMVYINQQLACQNFDLVLYNLSNWKLYLMNFFTFNTNI